MKCCTVVLLVSGLISLSRASESVPVATSCFIKGSAGTYGYDPTTNNGPDNWGKLRLEYKQCDTGKSQSPINIPRFSKLIPRSTVLKPKMVSAKMNLSSSSSNWALHCITPCTCGHSVFKGKKFNVVNLHFHSPSEHTIDGRHYPLEAHIVHSSDDEELAVISTLFKYGEKNVLAELKAVPSAHNYGYNNFFEHVLNGVQSSSGVFHANIRNIVRPRKGYFSYSGSLTTPPCSEGVTFFVANHVETISRRQVFDYQVSSGAGWDGNNRPTQPLNGRKVTSYNK